MTADTSQSQSQSPLPAVDSVAGPVPVRVGQLIAQLHDSNPATAAQAFAAFQELESSQPNAPVVRLGLGIALALQGRFGEALGQFEKAIALDPKFGAAWSNMGNLHKLQGRLAQAREAYNKAIALQPDLADAHFGLALVMEADGDLEASEAAVRRALLFNPAYAEAHNNLGRLLINAGKVEQAISHFRQALGANASLRPARNNLIMALYRLGRSAEAQAEVDQLLLIDPQDTQVLRVQAAGLAQQGRLGDAEAISRKLLALEPDAPDLQWNLGEVMLQRNDYEGALACYKEVLARRHVPPALAIGAMANVAQAQGNFSEARNLYQQALALAPNRPALLLGLARALLSGSETRQGLETLKRAVSLMPNAADVHSRYLLARRLDPACSATDHATEAKQWQLAHAKGTSQPQPARNRKPGAALRIGMLVSDLENGPTGAMLQTLIPALQISVVELIIYHAAPAGPVAHALQTLVPHWRPVAALGEVDLTQQIRLDGLDALIDLVGHGPGGRMPTLAQRVAPMQWGWLGDYSAAQWPMLDGIVSDVHLSASDDDPQTLRLPALLPWQPPHDAPDIGQLPMEDLGYPTLGVVSPLAHVQPPALDLWADILQAMPQARLLVLSDAAHTDEAALQRIQRLLMLRDVDPERVEVLPRLNVPQRWEALARMDLVLDTQPVPMGLVVLDCLWMGLPVLTLEGSEPWQRTTLSLLAQVGLSDCALQDGPSIVRRAADLLQNPTMLASLRGSLRERLQTSPCMDTAAFAVAFQQAVLAGCNAGGGLDPQ
jgi:protein O-GlcNAc transferase